MVVRRSVKDADCVLRNLEKYANKGFCQFPHDVMLKVEDYGMNDSEYFITFSSSEDEISHFIFGDDFAFRNFDDAGGKNTEEEFNSMLDILNGILLNSQ